MADAIASNWIAPIGPDVEAFEAEVAARCGVSFGVGLSSGTAALHLALEGIGVGPGDEVVVQSLTFVPTANAVRYLGATPVFMDSDRETWCLSPELLADELAVRERQGTLPKAVIAVDLYGRCADYEGLSSILVAFGVALIEDAAEALGASGRRQRTTARRFWGAGEGAPRGREGRAGGAGLVRAAPWRTDRTGASPAASRTRPPPSPCSRPQTRPA